jgi:hypothetical protein
MNIEDLEEVGAQSGLVLELEDIAHAEKIQPNQTPQGLDRIGYKADENIKGISGVSDSMQGFDREDVAAKAISYKTQNGAKNLTKVLDNLERTDWILAERTGHRAGILHRRTAHTHNPRRCVARAGDAHDQSARREP